MVGHHVPQRAGFFVEATAPFDAESLGGCDLNVVHMIAVPQRLEDAVGESQNQDILNGFFAEEVIDAVDLVLRQHFEDLRVESLGRWKVVAERLFNDHPPPSVLGLLDESSAAELLYDRPKEPVADRQIEEYVGRAFLMCELVGQQLLELAVGFGLCE